MGKCIDSRHHEPCKYFLMNITLLMVGQKKLMSEQMPRSGLATPVKIATAMLEATG